jgi:type IV secretory pathway VirB2 component (pilin)
MKSRVVVLTFAVLLSAAAPAVAQTVPALPALPPGVQTTVVNILQSLAGQAAAPYALDPNHVRGVVTYFKRFDLQVRLPLNRYRAIRLHQGTVINPRGATLASGDVIDVAGRANADGTLDADVVTLVHR